jgi:hypothetical protein
MERSEIADVKGEKGPAVGRREGQLFLVQGRVFAGFLRRQDIITAAAQVHSQPGHDVPVEVQADEEPFKAGRIGHGLALPER